MSEETLQQIASDVTLNWLHKHQIALFTVRTVSRNQLEGWFRAAKSIMDEWPQDRPLVMIHDDNYPGSSFTPAIRDYSIQLDKYRPDIVVHTAVVVPKTLMTQIVAVFMRTLRKSNRETRLFSTLEDAIDWAKTKL